MKKVLILSYFYPPGNFAGSYRVKSWTDYFPEFGYYPVLVTRHWNPNETDFTGISKVKCKKVEKTENGEFHYLPFRGGLRDRYLKMTGGRFQAVGRLLSFFEIILQNYFIWFCPYKNLYKEARRILMEDPEINLVIASGRPFYLFKFCYRLKKEFNYINWIADYRDPWNTSHVINSLRRKFFRFIEKPFEKRWIKNASAFTTCSEGFKKNISHIIKKPGYVITNGFNEFVNYEGAQEYSEFRIGYIGSLYENQQIETFLLGFKNFINSNKNPKIRIVFFGTGKNIIARKRIDNSLNGFEKHYIFLDWLEKKELLREVNNCQCFLLCGIPEQKGRHTAKFFDYLSFQKTIILCPSDNDIQEETLKETEAGFAFNTSYSISEWLQKSYWDFWKWRKLTFYGNPLMIEKFKYENQVRILAEVFEKFKS